MLPPYSHVDRTMATPVAVRHPEATMVAGFRNDPGAHGAAQHAIHEEVPLPPEQMGNLKSSTREGSRR